MKLFLLWVILLSFGWSGSDLEAQVSDSQENAAAKSAMDAEFDGAVLGALIFASHEKAEVATSDATLRPELVDKLKKIFPYQHFEVLGLQDHAHVLRAYESWIVPSKDFFLKVDSKGTSPTGGLSLHLQLWQEKNVLVKTDVQLQKESPLFIGGPNWRKGQLIFVLELK